MDKMNHFKIQVDYIHVKNIQSHKTQLSQKCFKNHHPYPIHPSIILKVLRLCNQPSASKVGPVTKTSACNGSIKNFWIFSTVFWIPPRRITRRAWVVVVWWFWMDVDFSRFPGDLVMIWGSFWGDDGWDFKARQPGQDMQDMQVCLIW